MGLGDISLKAVMETPYFQGPCEGERGYAGPDRQSDAGAAVFPDRKTDGEGHGPDRMGGCEGEPAGECLLCEDNGSPFTDAQFREATLQQVGMSLELGAQPLTKTQKSMNKAAGVSRL